MMEGAYEYSVEQNVLTLTDSEYGSQKTFEKKWKVNGDSASADDTERTCRAVETGVQIMYRNQTKEVRIGDVVIGGDHPIAIQSMTNTRTEDVEATVEQILRLEKAGCEIIRCTVPTMEAAKSNQRD